MIKKTANHIHTHRPELMKSFFAVCHKRWALHACYITAVFCIYKNMLIFMQIYFWAFVSSAGVSFTSYS